MPHRSSDSHASESDASAAARSDHADPYAGHHDAEASVAVLPARYVLLQLATALTGYTVEAMQRKSERGDWAEGRVWKHAPDRRIVIDVVGYQRWVEGQ